MKKPMASDEVINNLNFMCKTYDAITKTIVSTKNRLAHLNPEEDTSTNEIVKLMANIKDKIKRQITKELEFWPIYNDWMKDIPGIGPFIAGNLILLYYYRFVPVCPKCGTDVIKKEVETDGKKINTFYCSTCDKSIKGDGVLKHRIDKSKDFPNVSKWWAYLGEHVIDGKMPKRKKGVASNWSAKGRQISFQIGESFNKMKEDHLYKAFMLNEKQELERDRPELTKGHRHNMARMVTTKLFLSHFWHVARTLEEKSTRGVYADVILGHINIIPPYYWEEEK